VAIATADALALLQMLHTELAIATGIATWTAKLKLRCEINGCEINEGSPAVTLSIWAGVRGLGPALAADGITPMATLSHKPPFQAGDADGASTPPARPHLLPIWSPKETTLA
jgi:hypothetical protein